jgi:hypothetical protein
VNHRKIWFSRITGPDPARRPPWTRQLYTSFNGE